MPIPNRWNQEEIDRQREVGRRLPDFVKNTWGDPTDWKSSRKKRARAAMETGAEAAAGQSASLQREYERAAREQRQARAGQMELAQALQGQAAGRGLVSQEMLRQGLQQQLAMQQAQAASASPANAAAAARTAAIQGGRAAAGMSGQSALAGMQERAQAQQQLGALLGQTRQQDIGYGSGAGQLGQGYSGQALGTYGQLAELGGPQGPADWERWAGLGVGALGALAVMSDVRNKTDIKAAGGYAGVPEAEFFQGIAPRKEAVDLLESSGYKVQAPGETNWRKAVGSVLMNQVSPFLMQSDRGSKTRTSSGADDAEEMLRGLRAYTYRYKDPKAIGASPGRHIGVMAQDLEKSGMGRSVVMEGPRGKMIDVPRLASALAAGEANLDKRLRKLERDA